MCVPCVPEVCGCVRCKAPDTILTQVSVDKDASMSLSAPLVIRQNRFRGRIKVNYSYMFACLSSQGAEWE